MIWVVCLSSDERHLSLRSRAEGGSELEERRTAPSHETGARPRRRRSRAGSVVKGVFMTLLTLILVGCCTALMLFGIFMKYVNTSLLPTLEVNAEDYTMAQSSVVYYQD